MNADTKAAALAAAVARLTDALQAGPTEGPHRARESIVFLGFKKMAGGFDMRSCPDSHANAKLFAACDPATIRLLLDSITTLAARIAELEANGVHSCHPECTRPVCVLQRRVAELEAEQAGLVAAEHKRLAAEFTKRAEALNTTGTGCAPHIQAQYEAMAGELLDWAAILRAQRLRPLSPEAKGQACKS